MNALPAFLSVCCPGLGQLAQGRIMAGCFFFFGSILLFIVAFASMGIGLIVAIPFYVWAIKNAASHKNAIVLQMEKQTALLAQSLKASRT